LGLAATALAAGGIVLRGQARDISVAGRPVEIALSSVSPTIARITIRPISGTARTPIPVDGALVRDEWTGIAKYTTGLPSTRAAGDDLLGTVLLPGGRLRLQVELSNTHVIVTVLPPTSGTSLDAGRRRIHQVLRIDRQTAAITFPTTTGPILGLGEGGPQFDRRGSVDRMRSGQGGYQLRTHGGRVPIQWLIGTSGWAMYVHHPLGTFDFSGSDNGVSFGQFTPPAADPLPLDLFLTAGSPAEIMRARFAKRSCRATP
jgi:alpha-glucosidase/alpha-D-xyloside xylohydrolase